MTFLLFVPQNDKNSIESLMPLHQHDSQKSLKEKDGAERREFWKFTWSDLCSLVFLDIAANMHKAAFSAVPHAIWLRH